MTNKVMIATKNKGKASEFATLFSQFGLEVSTLLDIENHPDIEETGNTFEENARIKAETLSLELNEMVLADDSGLIVDELDGAPGIYSARYAGVEKNDEANIDKLLYEMRDVPENKRTARFYCALALAIPGEETIFVSGKCEGKILTERHGVNGFGYDPIFFASEVGKSMAELTNKEKNKISHRSEALKNLEPILRDLFIQK
ncbi:XTP/dITP diphosphatase [Lederbergia galactosidilytica]|uniref:dITP/XTP pyrophosphatase n=1 Tax=Lederbergia galactosidilytica TaxID=217031 RepID=A0A178A3Z6_9BACI|nr:XTP/dITP diphosphatase [Lederbergia galactosidilytica]KRG14432.1 nucleoside-triphosphate diphosphatase [Virgibacillus soli]MBP1914962.1 XTP/dITP diphosphohydrolase [Lederbergia galactosidilytica]OAK74240.1 nucleoside-triphosphate diphosphatase [Lederbergia galactosidilytica]